MVRLVIELVNSLTLPTTLLEKFCTPFTIEEAKAEPGKDGNEMLPPPPPGLPEGALTVVGPDDTVEGWKVGS